MLVRASVRVWESASELGQRLALVLALPLAQALESVEECDQESVLASAAESALASLQALALASVRLKALPLESAQELDQR